MAGHEENSQGVDVEATGHKQMKRDYRQSDMEVLYRRGNWNTWDDMINWLEKHGEQDDELTPGEAIAMTEDLRKLKESGQSFTPDPARTYEMAHQHRG